MNAIVGRPSLLNPVGPYIEKYQASAGYAKTTLDRLNYNITNAHAFGTVGKGLSKLGATAALVGLVAIPMGAVALPLLPLIGLAAAPVAMMIAGDFLKNDSMPVVGEFQRVLATYSRKPITPEQAKGDEQIPFETLDSMVNSALEFSRAMSFPDRLAHQRQMRADAKAAEHRNPDRISRHRPRQHR